MSAELKATFSQSRNDMYWKVFDKEDGFVRWIGYDDQNWWDRVSATDQFRNRVGPVSGRTYRLDPETNSVTCLDDVVIDPALAKATSHHPEGSQA